MVSAAAAQLGILAACVVLFVPMSMAGYHLSRNKMLFFGGALFITLAVFVHLAPYFPSLSHLFFPPSLPPLPLSCLPLLHSISFHEPSSFSFSRSAAVSSCKFQKLSKSDASDLLNGSWILIAGDSQSRLFALSLLSLILDPSAMEKVEGDLFRRHSDYQILIADHGIKVDFVWSPYESNITTVVQDLGHGLRYPDVLVAGSGLWHMLHVSNASDYGSALTGIRKSAVALELGFGSPHMFWIGMPTLVHSILNTEEKREKMNQMMWEAYDKEVDRSRILRRSGGPFLLLDVGLLSRSCGVRCTADGMHYDQVVYEAVVQIMLNALLIESQQRI